MAAKPSYSEPSYKNLRHEMAHQPSAADAKEAFRKEHSEEDRVTLTSEGLTAAQKLDRELWTKWLREWEAALKVCTDPAERMRLGASIQRARSKLNEQRNETAAGTS